MPPFTKKRNQNDEEEESNVNSNENYELSLLAIAKKVGLSFYELNMLTMNDFMDFIDIHLEKPNKNDEVVARDANQNDIDKFYSNK